MQSDKIRIFDMNLDPLSGSHWIKNIDKLDKNEEYILYATGDANLSGRKYVAIPANRILTYSEKLSLNIW